MGDTSRFFAELKDHSEIKLRIFQQFIVPWAAKLGYKARGRGANQLWYVDGFAGPGKYEDGSDGSPIIAAQQAANMVVADSPIKLGCVNVEVDRPRFSELEANTSRFKDSGVEIYNINDDFSNSIAQILRIVGDSDPVLAFVDPFGIKPVKFNRLQRLIERSGEIDMFLTFNTPAVSRLATDNPNLISEAIGSANWTSKDIVRQMMANLKMTGRFFDVLSYPIRAEKDAPPKYDLLLASRSYTAFELLNDSVAAEESRLKQKAYAMMAPNFLQQWEEQASERELLDAIQAFGMSKARTTRQQIVRHLVLKFWERWHTGDMKKATATLVDVGKAHREHAGKIDTDPLTFG